MKKTISLLFISATLVLTGCGGPENQQKAGRIVAEMWGAQSSVVGNSSAKDAEQREKKALTLTLENLKAVEAGYSDESITSASAYVYLNNIPEEEYTDYENVIVTLKNNSSVFERSYKITDLLIVKEAMATVDKFSSKVTSGDIDGLEAIFDTTVVADATLFKIKNAIHTIENDLGRQNKASMAGFTFARYQSTNEPIVIILDEISNETSHTIYKLVIRISDKKIVDLAIN